MSTNELLPQIETVILEASDDVQRAEIGRLMHELDENFSADPVPTERMERITSSPNHVQLATTYEGQMAGVATLSTLLEPDRKAYYLGAVVSDPKYREMKVRAGARLMRGMVDTAQVTGHEAILLGTETDKKTSPLSFYEKLGAEQLPGTAAYALDVSDAHGRDAKPAHGIYAAPLESVTEAEKSIDTIGQMVRQRSPELSDDAILERLAEIDASDHHTQLLVRDREGTVIGIKNMHVVYEPGFEGQMCMIDSLFAGGMDAKTGQVAEEALLRAAVRETRERGLDAIEILAKPAKFGNLANTYTRYGAQVLPTTVLLEFDTARHNIPEF